MVEREEESDGTFALVERAAEVAAQKVAAIHRRRLVTQAFLAALAAAAAIAIPVTLITSHERALAARDNARYNCTLLSEIGDVLHDFIASDAKLRRDQQNLGNRVELRTGLNRLFGSKVVRDLTARSKTLDRGAQKYWQGELLPRVARMAKLNCDTVLTAEGPAASPVPR